VVFAPDFHERLADIELPEDWGIFYLGCRHWQRPESAGQRLVRVTRALDTHAYAVRAEHFERLLRAFRRPKNPGSSAEGVLDWGVDFPIADLQRDIPTYACWPDSSAKGCVFTSSAGSFWGWGQRPSRGIAPTFIGALPRLYPADPALATL
jgi:hypothetical protein